MKLCGLCRGFGFNFWAQSCRGFLDCRFSFDFCDCYEGTFGLLRRYSRFRTCYQFCFEVDVNCSSFRSCSRSLSDKRREVGVVEIVYFLCHFYLRFGRFRRRFGTRRLRFECRGCWLECCHFGCNLFGSFSWCSCRYFFLRSLRLNRR